MRTRNFALYSWLLLAPATANAFLEDICLPRPGRKEVLTWCVRPECPEVFSANRACPTQLADFATIQPGRSMIHADSTYFIAQALGFRADVAYWIAAYDEVTDYAKYEPIDQCGVVASAQNSGKNYIAAPFNGFQRTNANTDGPLDHYVVSFSPNGQGTDVHGAGGVSSLYPLHYPQPGYPLHIDDTYQKTLANMRAWAMLPSRDPGLLCTVGLTASASGCVSGMNITGTVPLIMKSSRGIPLNVPAGKKVLNYDTSTSTSVYYDQLGAYLDDKTKTTGTLWKDPAAVPVPVQVARIGLFLHVLQDTSSHATYCGDDAPTPPGGSDRGTYMYMTSSAVQVSFGDSCASSPHLAGHVQETGTGKNPLPLRDYVALNNTLDELINFGVDVASKHPGWIVNPELLPPNVVGGKSAQGFSAAELKATLVGTIVSGKAYSNAEVYQSGVVTLPLQQEKALDRLHAMNRALGDYSATLRKQSKRPPALVALEPMPGNSFDPKDTSACWH
ncbi:MAG: hypothetical protein RL685_4996 [Pseudomonadota bacterium]|jgi:hypothetical protein